MQMRSLHVGGVMLALNGRRVPAQEGHNGDYSVFDNYLVKVKNYMKNHNRTNLKKKKKIENSNNTEILKSLKV